MPLPSGTIANSEEADAQATKDRAQAFNTMIAAVLTVNPIRLAQSRESGDAPCHGGHAQTDLVGGDRALPITSVARGGDPGAAPSAECAEKKIAKATRLQQFRSARFCQSLSDCAGCSECLADCQAGDGHLLASCRVSFVLAMKVAMSRRQAKGASRNPPADPRHEPGQPAVGCSPASWRTPQARHQHWSNLGRQIHSKAQKTPVSRVEDFSAQPRRRDRIHGPVCYPDALLSTALWLADSRTRPAPNVMARSDSKPNR